MITEKFVIESYTGFTDEKYLELHDTKEDLWQSLEEMAVREDWIDDKKEIFDDLKNEGEHAQGYDYIKIYKSYVQV